MSKIKAKDLLELGFKRADNFPSSAQDIEYHYYTFEVGKKCLLISCSNDEKVNGGYDVEFFDVTGMKFRKLNQLKKLVKLLKEADNE